MKRVLSIVFILLFANLYSIAQTFTEKVTTVRPGEGSVIFYQEPYLEAMLNGTEYPPKQLPKPKIPVSAEKKNVPPKKKDSVSGTADSPVQDISKNVLTITDKSNISSDQYKKKIYKNSTTVNGYRIQLYSGSNSRESRQKAYSVGYLFKSNYLNIPVYTHFVSPRWTCCVGNFKTYADALAFLSEIKASGQFNGAMIVKSKIQVVE